MPSKSLIAALVLFTILIGGRAYAACTTAVAVTTSSTQVVAANDLGNNPRHYIAITNSGPDVAFCAIGTSNAATTANGILLLIGETIPFAGVQGPGGVFTFPPTGDVSCIAFNGGGNTTANISVCDW